MRCIGGKPSPYPIRSTTPIRTLYGLACPAFPRSENPRFNSCFLQKYEATRRKVVLAFASNHNLPCSFSKWFPIVAAVDGLDAEAAGQEEQLEFAREEDVHIEFAEVAFVLAAFKKLLVGPEDMLQLLNGVIFAAGIEQHGKLVGDFDLIFYIYM